jgi:fumarylacetoacetate (FAA) hydrolase family protein
MKYITNLKDIPDGMQLAALVSGTVYIPGDERSVTNPGHGHPSEHRPIIEFVSFKDRGEMEEWVKQREASKSSQSPYKIIQFTPVGVAVEVKITFPTATRS